MWIYPLTTYLPLFMLLASMQACSAFLSFEYCWQNMNFFYRFHSFISCTSFLNKSWSMADYFDSNLKYCFESLWKLNINVFSLKLPKKIFCILISTKNVFFLFLISVFSMDFWSFSYFEQVICLTVFWYSYVELHCTFLVFIIKWLDNSLLGFWRVILVCSLFRNLTSLFYG